MTRGQLPRINITRLLALPVPVPDPAIQRNLGSVLGRLAHAADDAGDAATTLDSLPGAYLHRLLAEAEQDGINRWTEVRLGEVAPSIEYGVTASASDGTPEPSADSVRLVRITDIGPTGHLKADGGVYFTHLSTEDYSRYRLSDGDLLFARTGFSIGNTYLYRSEDGPAIFASYLIRARIDADLLDPEYVAAYMHTPEARAMIRYASRGQGKPNLNKPRIASLRIPVPSDDVRDRLIAQSRQCRAVAAELRRLRLLVYEAIAAVMDRAMHGDGLNARVA